MAHFGKSANRVRLDTLKVAQETHPGWESGAERLPRIGTRVQCTEGLAEVVKVLGKTGDGSRLLELVLPDRPKQPFFAAASNVLVAPDSEE